MDHVNARRARPALDRWSWLLVLFFGALFVALGIHFARVQNLWVDETTQLLGSRLPMPRLLAWLAGAPEPLGVPNDRMPPVSYMVDAAWSDAGFRDELSFRLLHLAIAAAGVLLLLRLVARRYGAVAAAVAGSLLVLHPQMTSVAVEIRTYPLFFAVTALQLVLFYRIYDGQARESGRMIAFTAVSVLSAYTHFFGIVSGCAFFSGLLLTRARSGADLGRIAAYLISFLLLSAGILPFVKGAAAISRVPEVVEPAYVADLALYVVRSAGHSAMMIEPWLAALYFLGLFTLLAIAAARAIGWPVRLRQPLRAEAGLLVAVIAGMAASMAAALVLHGFDPLKPSYSIWLWAPRAVLAASAVGIGLRGRWRGLALAASAVLIVSLILSQALFLHRERWFIHGPERVVVDEIRRQRGPTAIVYDGADWAWLYFPLIYRFGPGFPQYVRDAAGALHRLGTDGNPRTPALSSREVDRFRHIILADVELKTYSDLRPLERGDQQGLTIGSASAPPPVPAGWSRTATRNYPGVYALRLTRFDREMR